MKKEKTVNNERITERNNKIKETLQSLIFPTIFALIILGLVWFVVHYQNIEKPQEVIETHNYTGGEEPVVMENDKLLFTMDPLTTQFTVKVKETGKEWRSNPEGAAGDTHALSEEKDKLQSPLLMSYAVETGLETQINSFSQSTQNGVYDIEQGDGYIRVDYSMGDIEKEFVIPPAMSVANYEKWYDAATTDGKKLIKKYYREYDIDHLKKDDNKEELLAEYPELASEHLYILHHAAKDNVKTKLERFFEEAGYTYDDYLADKKHDSSGQATDKPVFNVSMIYRLDGGDLTVEVPFKDIQFRSDYPVYTLTPLPYFGAGGPEDDGYILVPEGGGSLIDFNNGKISQATYYANVYGWDMCVTRKAVVHNTRAYYGVYGIASKEDSFICILEDGRTYAAIQADIAGKNHSYNFANAIYSICRREQYDVGDIANSDIYKYDDVLPDESLIQRYRFINSGDYSDMAKNYRDYLKEKYGQYLSLNTDQNAPAEVEIVGAVDKIRQILGVPVSRPLKLTSFDEASAMIRALKEDGVANLSVKLRGWCNGGVRQKILKKTHVISSLGGAGKLKNLADTANSEGVNLYLNGITQYACDSDLLDGFFSYTDAAKLISKERVRLLEYSRTTYGQRDDLDPYFLLHTEIAGQMSDNLASQAQKYGVGASFEDDGKELSSDFYKKKPYSREAVSLLQEDRFKGLDSTKVMINMGNDYAVPYVDMVTNMDLHGSGYTILDACVPFYQLALHGYIDYTGEPLNICGNYEEELLNSVEYGAGLSWTVMQESPFILQKTMYTEFYGSEFDVCRKDIAETYGRYNRELGHTFCQEMSDHSFVTKDVTCTTYDDGTKVYVNYAYEDFDANGLHIPARDYLVVR